MTQLTLLQGTLTFFLVLLVVLRPYFTPFLNLTEALSSMSLMFAIFCLSATTTNEQSAGESAAFIGLTLGTVVLLYSLVRMQRRTLCLNASNRTSLAGHFDSCIWFETGAGLCEVSSSH